MRSRGPFDRAILLALYALSAAALALAARALGVRVGEGPYTVLGATVGEVFGGAGGHGMAAVWRALSGLDDRPAPLVASLAAGGGWAVFSRLGGEVIDGLTALRFGGVAVTASVAPLVYAFCRRDLGPNTALLAGLLALFVPRWLVAGATLGADGPLTAFALATLVAYRASIDRPSFAAALAAGGFFGLALATSPFALGLVVVVGLHGAFAPRDPEIGRRHRVGAAGAIAAMLVGGPLMLVAQPTFWPSPLSHLRQWLARGFMPVAEPSLWRGRTPPLGDLPRDALARLLVLATPSTTLALALVGAALTLWLGWRRERVGASVALAGLVTGAAIAWSLVAPASWRSFPGHVAPLLPCLAVLAAYGARAAASALARVMRGSARGPASTVVFVLAVAVPAAACLVNPATLGAAFPVAAGGARRAARGRVVPLHDATPLQAFVGVIDGAGQDETSVYSPDLAPEIWELMFRLARLRTWVHPVASADLAEWVVLSGNERPSASFAAHAVRWSLARDGQSVMALYRRASAPPTER